MLERLKNVSNRFFKSQKHNKRVSTYFLFFMTFSLSFAKVDKGEKSNSCNEKDLKKYMQDERVDIIVDLGLGKESFTAYTMDLTKKYIEINADYRS